VSAVRERSVECFSEVFGLGPEEQGFIAVVDFQLMFSFLVEMEDCQHCFCTRPLSFNFQVWRYPPTVAVSFLSTLSTVCQSPSAYMIVSLLAYTYVLETVVDKTEM